MPVIESFYCFIDTETTGTKEGWHEPTEVAAILTNRKLKEISRFYGKFQPRFPDRMDPEAQAVNGYDAEVWAREAIKPSAFKNWLEAQIPRPHVAIAVGYKAGFDRDIIAGSWYAKGEFFKLAYRPVDLMTFSRGLESAGVIDVPNLKFATVMAAIGMKEQTHRAMDDCEAALEFYKIIMQALKDGFAMRTLPAQPGKAPQTGRAMPQLSVPAGHVGTPGSHIPIERLGRKDAPPQLDLNFPPKPKATGTESFL